MNNNERKPFIEHLYRSPMSGASIEAASFAEIDREAPPHRFDPAEWEVVRRMIHTTADFGLMDSVKFSSDVIDKAATALRSGAPIYVDSNMIRSGISISRLQSVCADYRPEQVACHVADADVAQKAGNSGLPRALFSVRKASAILDGAIVMFGNSPVGLLEVNRLIIEERIRPALVIGMPVGFIHVLDSKQELMELDVPWIVLTGRRGGSPLVVSVLHALCSLAGRGGGAEVARDTRDEEKVPREGSKERSRPSTEAIILLGHGSRVPEAGKAMAVVAEELKGRYHHEMVEICFMSRLGPYFEETLDKCVKNGASRVIVIPYFLHGGLHMKLDIPEMLQQTAEKFPDVQVILGERLGFDALLVDIVEKRIHESAGNGDVRTLILPPKDKYPLPPGQHEFVAMPPEMAHKWGNLMKEESKE